MTTYPRLALGGAVLAVLGLGLKTGMEYQQGRKYLSNAMSKHGIDPKDVRSSSCLSVIRNLKTSEDSDLYGERHENDLLFREGIGKIRELYCKLWGPGKFVEYLVDNLTPEERLKLVKEGKRGKYIDPPESIPE